MSLNTIFRNRYCAFAFQFKSREKALIRHDIVMRLLVRRYVTAEQRKSEEFGITEDDVMEIRQDISSMRFEMVDIFKQNGYKTPAKEHDSNVGENMMYFFFLRIRQFVLFE